MFQSYVVSALSFGETECDGDYWWFRENKRAGFADFLSAKSCYQALQLAFTQSIHYLQGQYFIYARDIASLPANPKYDLVKFNPYEYFIKVKIYGVDAPTLICPFEEELIGDVIDLGC